MSLELDAVIIKLLFDFFLLYLWLSSLSSLAEMLLFSEDAAL